MPREVNLINISTMCVCGDMQQMRFDDLNLFYPHINRKTGQPCPGFQLSKEVYMTQAYTDEWFKEMGKRIKARDHANEMAARWLKKAAEAETAIAALSNGTMQLETETVTEQE